MATQQQAFIKLQQYASKVEDTGHDTTFPDENIVYEARLKKTLKGLQDQVKQQEAALEKVILSR